MALLVAAVLLAGCTGTLADVKPGAPRPGIKESGYDKTTEGLSMTVVDRTLDEVNAAVERAVESILAGPKEAGVTLVLVERQPGVLKLQALDRFRKCCVYYVGIFITSKGRETTVEVNWRAAYALLVAEPCPCEGDYLRAIERELAQR